MLKNASALAIVTVDTAENEPLKFWGDLFILVNALLGSVSVSQADSSSCRDGKPKKGRAAASACWVPSGGPRGSAFSRGASLLRGLDDRVLRKSASAFGLMLIHFLLNDTKKK